jgi:hypothetical protein
MRPIDEFIVILAAHLCVELVKALLRATLRR